MGGAVMDKDAEELDAATVEELLKDRPQTRADCMANDAPRPCPYVGCRYHLYLEVRNGKIYHNFPGKEFDELEETCSLDLASMGGMTLEEVADVMGMTRQRIFQHEEIALRKIRRHRESRKGLLEFKD